MVFIDEYKGFGIEFDTNEEKFYCALGTTKEKNSSSYSAIKKAIDEHLKLNDDFSPFKIVKDPFGRICTKGVVKSKTIDGRFIWEPINGKSEIIKQYDLSDYIIEPENFDEVRAEFDSITSEFELVEASFEQRLKETKSKCKQIRLK